MLNPDIACLLGMIVGKGVLVRGNKETEVIISIPHRNLEIEGQNTQLSVKASLWDIRDRLRPLVGADIESDTSSQHTAHIKFSKDNGDYLIRDLNQYLDNNTTWRFYRIHGDIFKASEDIKKEFLRGFADVTGHIRKTNSAYGINYNHRVYLEIMDNWMLVVDIANLLKDLDIPIHVIRWAHPNFVDPNLKFYKKGMRNYKEHQIKIWAEEFEKIGFSIEHKNKLLKKYAQINLVSWDEYYKDKIKHAKTNKTKQNYKSKIGNIEEFHHKFYWKTKDISKNKPIHPDENHNKIHSKIRGRHFNSWKKIAKELGYHE